MDCLALHEVITKFNELIFSEFSINVHKILTLSSLAMKIFKTHYMKKDTIYQLLGSIESNIRKSYTGGAVDAYIPSNRINSHLDRQGIYRKLFYYDVNSLYPTVMANCPMPIGRPIAFKGDIRTVDAEAYGVFYCNITSPAYLEHPILQKRVRTKDGMRTIAGLGNWTGWITSVERDNGIKCGYQFEILRGYQFDKGDLFSGYVNKLYNLRKSYPKSNPMNLVAKLLMNSLYGKFGMSLNIPKVEVHDISTYENIEKFKKLLGNYKETVKDWFSLDEDNVLLIRDRFLSMKYDEKEDMYLGAAEARILMLP